jgi:hypothetical protein
MQKEELPEFTRMNDLLKVLPFPHDPEGTEFEAPHAMQREELPEFTE